MIIDTSALVAALTNEPDGELYRNVIADAGGSTMSAASYLECGVVLDRQPEPLVGRRLDVFLREARVDIGPVTEGQARIARAAYRDFGRGSGHRARLNFGDCFSYALAIERNQALLFKGDGFTHTDVRRALPDR